MSSVYDEWYGINKFDSNKHNNYFKGGINKLEKMYNTKWRKHYNDTQKRRFS